MFSVRCLPFACERPSLRFSPTPQKPRFHRRGRAHARPGHRGEHRDLQRRERRVAPPSALSRSGPARAHRFPQPEPRPGGLAQFGIERARLATAEHFVREHRGFSGVGWNPHLRRKIRTGPRQLGYAQPDADAGSEAAARRIAPGRRRASARLGAAPRNLGTPVRRRSVGHREIDYRGRRADGDCGRSSTQRRRSGPRRAAARSGCPPHEPSAAGFSARLAALQRGGPAQTGRLRRAGANGTQHPRRGTRTSVSDDQSRLGRESDGPQSLDAGAGAGSIIDGLFCNRSHPAHRLLERVKPAADSRRGPAQGTCHPLRARLDSLAAGASVVQ